MRRLRSKARRLGGAISLALSSVLPRLARRLLVGAAAGASFGASGAADDGSTEAAAIRAILGPDGPREEMFAPSFLSAVPFAQIEAIVGGLAAQIGSVDAVEPTADGFSVAAGPWRMATEIALDADGRIVGLLFQPPVRVDLTVADAAKALEAFGDDVAYLVTRDGEILSERSPDRPLAVGSAFKLGVLAALDAAVARGDAAWDEVATLKARHVSLPSGMLQDFPVGAPLTLHSLATLMISLSDNTATDMLMERVGRRAVADALDLGFALTTKEFFHLKADPDAARAFAAASPAEKAGLVEAYAEAAPPSFPGGTLPHFDPAIEWSVSPRRLCALIEGVAHLDLLGV
ncbi:MAG: serine hydrolase, partial [Pseudomonadota bacterium]